MNALLLLLRCALLLLPSVSVVPVGPGAEEMRLNEIQRSQ